MIILGSGVKILAITCIFKYLSHLPFGTLMFKLGI